MYVCSGNAVNIAIDIRVDIHISILHIKYSINSSVREYLITTCNTRPEATERLPLLQPQWVRARMYLLLHTVDLTSFYLLTTT